MRTLLLLWFLASGLGRPLGSGPTPPDLQAELQALVRLETPAARERRALELAGRKGTSLEAWLSAMMEFGRFEEQPAGTRVERLDLRVGEATETTPIHLHVPESYTPEEKAPLLLAFHGTGGDGSTMVSMWEALAEKLGLIVVAPSETGANQGYEFSDRERRAALAALRWARLSFNIDEDRVFAEGEPFQVTRNGTKVRRRPKPSKEVLLVEFAERFDRVFLPVVAVEI